MVEAMVPVNGRGSAIVKGAKPPRGAFASSGGAPASAGQRHPATVVVGGLTTLAVSRAQLARMMVNDCLDARMARPNSVPRIVFSSNGQAVAMAGRDPDFARLMGRADIVHADGMSVVIASRLNGRPLPERVATTDFFDTAARAACGRGLRFFFLGGSEDLNEAAVTAAAERYPGLEIVGRHHGYFPDAKDAEVCERVRASGADVLWVGLGRPRQERWALANRNRLKGVGWIKTCGGLFSFVSGASPRAPRWVQSTGFEWLYRAACEPRRLGWRYMTTNPYALYRLARFTERPRKRV